MTIAEFFVEIGVKGSDKTVGAFKSIKNGLSDMKSMSLEAKAAIIGAIYGLERMMNQSAKMGSDLTNFAELTGLSVKSLQQWQYAARQAGVSSEEFTGNLKGVQQAMSNMLMGKGAPEGMGLLANKVGFDPARARDTFYVMEQLQKFAQSDVPKDLQNNVLKSFGLGEGTIAAMRRNVFRPDVFKQAPVYSDGQLKQLDKVNVAWSNLGQKIQMAFGGFTAKHGMELVSQISKITNEFFKLADALMKVADRLKVFDGIRKVFEGWGMILNGLTEQVDKISSNKGGVLEGMKDFGKGFWEGTKDTVRGAYLMATEDAVAPPAPAGARGGVSNNQMTVNQTLNFQHDGKDHKKTGASVKEAVQKAYRQNGATKGGY